jgi:outer membrane receptor protein involved in Fe transport
MRFTMKTFSGFFCLIALLCQPVFSQEIHITGKVRHANTYTVISDVNIFIQNTNLGTISHSNGIFTITVSSSNRDSTIVFRHVSFHPLRVSVREAARKNVFYLRPRVIQGPVVSVVGERDQPQILKDLPQPITVIQSEAFDVRGYVDAGDLLRTEQSVQVEENISGKKTVAIRGGNPDDVLVLYNGIKMNTIYDNVFDFSILNLDDVKQLEVIRGSNTTLYGAEAVSGVINIIPKTYRNYNIRFQQKFGTYALGAWNLYLNHNFMKKFNLSYSYKKEATRRDYGDIGNGSVFLENKGYHHTASLVYNLAPKTDRYSAKTISLTYLNSILDYTNNRYDEILSDHNQIVSIRYQGDLWIVKNMNMMGSYHWFDKDHSSFLESSSFDRYFYNRAFQFHVDNSFHLNDIEVLLGYQFENSELDFQDQRDNKNEQMVGVESAVASRLKHGLVSILKWHIPTTGSSFYKTTDFDISYRFDDIQDRFRNVGYRSAPSENGSEIEDPLTGNHWKESMLKFSSHFSGNNGNLGLNAYLNIGTNNKFPTMFQQLSRPAVSDSDPESQGPDLFPEKNQNVEIGINLIKETNNDPNISGYQININYFRNAYQNKFRTYFVPEIPVAYYDNVQNAEISGFEMKGSVLLIQNKLTAEYGLSLYSISDKSAFPFKSETKHIMNLMFDHAGYSAQIHWFKESDQVGWVRDLEGVFSELNLNGYSNIDIHIGKRFEWRKLTFFVNFSGRNILDDDTLLEGIAIRDRRLYITLGIQY